ncbi:MAG: 1-deoxy-D-xylulose-5-phosphate reductoisomerase [Clostridia bacterium]|nr:1-deoxy-D-xylulose-5-phosphate reductoisomerase [Clostridia bacterium]
MKNVAIFGCSGSIGKQTIDVIRKNKDKFNIVFATNNHNYTYLNQIKDEFNIPFTYCESIENKDFNIFSNNYINECVYSNKDLYANIDIVVNGISGINGLVPSYYALKYGKILATANKESFVCAGQFLNKVKVNSNSFIYPLDSEHSGIWQIFNSGKDLKKLYITASGGAFRDLSIDQIKMMKAKDALNHPNWKMGEKVTIDCATLVNKGFELIEAKRIFNFSNIEAIMHKQSLIHAMAEFNDNTITSCISKPSMLLPISYALNYPDRIDVDVESIDFEKLTELDFEKIDENKFPCFAICKNLFKYGDDYECTVLCAADDFATKLYLEDKIGFYDINKILELAINNFTKEKKISNSCFELKQIIQLYKNVLEYLERNYKC